MDALKQAALQEFRNEVLAELMHRGWSRSKIGLVHPDFGIIEDESLMVRWGDDVSEEADSLELAARDRHAEMLGDPEDQYDPLEEFRAELENRGMTPLDLFAAVLGDELMSRKISTTIEILGGLDRDRLGDSFDNICGAILVTLVYMLADPSQKS